MDIAILFANLAAVALLPIFWLPLVIVLLVLWSLVVYEKGGFATFFTIVFGVMVAAKFPAFIDFISNPYCLVGTIVAYALIGVLWSRYKWSNFLTKKLDHFVGMRNAFLKGRNLPNDHFKTNPDDTDTVKEFVEYVDRRTSFNFRNPTTLNELYRKVTPNVTENKGSIVMWIAYWPISVIWFVVADLATEMKEAIYRAVSGHFQQMAEDKFKAM